MTAPNFDQVVELVKALTPGEQKRLRNLLIQWHAPQPIPTEEEFEQEMARKGLLYVPPPITDFTPYQNRKLIEVKGKPLSETIIEERR